MRVVFDTNALIGVALRPQGNAGDVFTVCGVHRARVFISTHIILELEKTLKEDFGFKPSDAKHTAQLLLKQCSIIKPRAVVIPRISPADCVVLGTCLAAEADYLVTYDKDLLALKTYRHTKIVRPEALRRIL